ncbi:MAG: hypothetical protein LC808_11915, partial [Actinobacteria bacterium]|nr:hypothetical protein [Actinomycetota bacterium]
YGNADAQYERDHAVRVLADPLGNSGHFPLSGVLVPSSLPSAGAVAILRRLAGALCAEPRRQVNCSGKVLRHHDATPVFGGTTPPTAPGGYGSGGRHQESALSDSVSVALRADFSDGARGVAVPCAIRGAGGQRAVVR